MEYETNLTTIGAYFYFKWVLLDSSNPSENISCSLIWLLYSSNHFCLSASFSFKKCLFLYHYIFGAGYDWTGDWSSNLKLRFRGEVSCNKDSSVQIKIILKCYVYSKILSKGGQKFCIQSSKPISPVAWCQFNEISSNRIETVYELISIKNKSESLKNQNQSHKKSNLDRE